MKTTTQTTALVSPARLARMILAEMCLTFDAAAPLADRAVAAGRLAARRTAGTSEEKYAASRAAHDSMLAG